MTDHCAYPKCGKELTHIPGRRKKKYCNPVCKLRHWQELNPVKKSPKTKRIPLDEWEKIQKKVQDLSKPNTEVKPVEQPKTNYNIKTEACPEFEKSLADMPEDDKKRVDEQMEVAEKISKLEKELAAIPDTTKGFGKTLGDSLKRRIYALKYPTNK